MNEQAEMDAALDALELEHGIEEQPAEEPQEFSADEELDDMGVSEMETTDEEPEPEQEPAEKPPGYLSYQDWIDKGKDPADYKGENAYKAEYERIHEIKDLKETMNRVASGVDEWKQVYQRETQAKIAQAKLDAVAEFERAKTDLDIDAALAAQQRINELDQQPATQQQPKVNPVIQDFYSKNPIVDPTSQNFDKEFYEDMREIQGVYLDQFTGGSNEKANALSPERIQKSMMHAYSRAKELHPDKFVSKRNSRQSAPQSAKRSAAKPTDYQTKLKNTRFASKNSNDTNAAREIYDMIKLSDPAQAEIFAKNVLGE